MMFSRKMTGLFLCLLVVLAAASGASWTSVSARQASDVSARQASDPTATPTGGGPFITVTYEEPINVRGGPNSVYYPIVGSLPIGAVAEAVGRSPGGEWIKIIFPAASDGSGVGWVYAPLVTLSPGSLPIVQPPPTAVPNNPPTLDPAFVASLQPAPTSTRPPTFTAPPPLVVPEYDNPVDGGGFSTGIVVVILSVAGLVGLFFTSPRRRR